VSVFVGRDRELATLHAHLSAPGRRGGVLLVNGPAGVGKSTLVDRAIRQVGAVPVVRGYCPAEPAPPLWPWRTALRRAGAEVADETDIEPAAAVSARYSALARMSDALIAVGALVVVLEDLHWADAASLDLLAQVGRAAAESDLTIIATVRSPAPEDVAVRLAGLGRYGATNLTVAPFTADEVAQLNGPESAQDVHQRTGGLPLLVTAVRAGYRSADLTTVVRGLLTALSPQQRDIVQAAAVLGESIEEHLVAAAAGAGDDAVAEALVAAWHGGLMTVDDTTRRYRFAHALVRDRIAEHLDPPTTRRLHRAAALALESSNENDRAGRIASHWRRAGTEPETRRTAARWTRRAAVRARSAHAYEDATRLLADALADISSVDGGEVERAEVLIELADAEYLAGRYDRCLERCVDAADVAGAAGRGDLVARSALVLQGVNYPQAADVVSRLCQRALAYPGITADLRARLLAQWAAVEADSGRVTSAEGLAREALVLAAESADPYAEIEAARAREATLVHADDIAERLRLGDLVTERAETLELPLAAVLGHEWRVQAAYAMGRIDVVDDAATAIERLATRSSLPLAHWHLHRLIASRAMLDGRFTESIEHSTRATAIARGSGDQIANAMHFAHGIQLALVTGDAAVLPDGYREALATAPSIPLIDVERANVLAITGAIDEAREFYDKVATLLPVPAEHPAWLAVVTQMVGLIRRFDDATAAEIAYRQMLPFRPYPGAFGSCTVYFRGTLSRDLGELAAIFGDTVAAIELLREALERNRTLGARPDIAETALSLAGLLRRGSRADLAEAAQLVQNSLDLANRLNMPGTIAAAGRMAALISADRDEVDPLTAREHQIALMVADAMTNRQIAARLVLSERTVESHVRSILAKTQCTNRTEFVARWRP
jgi:DNA-binding CsgD family transcriptional regulator